jgi:hypothetical protein
MDTTGRFDDELVGGRWNPHFNILVGAATLASKLGAGTAISADGKITSVPVTGLSLDPSEANIWAGVQAYNGSGPDAVKYMNEVKARYKDTYQSEVADAVLQSRADSKNLPITLPGGQEAELRKRVLESTMITFTRASQRDDIRYGLIHKEVLIFLLVFTASGGFPVVITALKSDHNKFTSEGNISAHSYGLAVDLGNYGNKNPLSDDAMRWIGNYRVQLGFSQLIGPDDSLVIPLGGYDTQTLREHDSHIHVGWPLSLART